MGGVWRDRHEWRGCWGTGNGLKEHRQRIRQWAHEATHLLHEHHGSGRSSTAIRGLGLEAGVAAGHRYIEGVHDPCAILQRPQHVHVQLRPVQAHWAGHMVSGGPGHRLQW